MRIRSLLIIFLLASILVCPSLGLTWPAVLDLAAKQSNEIQAAQKQLAAYQWSYYKSYSSFLPQISGSLSTGQSQASSGITSSSGYGLSGKLSLFSGLENYYNVKSANVTLDYYQANLQNTLANVYYEARLDFIALYIARRNIAVRETIKEYREKNARLIKLRYDTGREDKGNWMRTEAQFADAKYNVAAAGRALYLAQLKLVQLLEAEVPSTEGVLQIALSAEGEVESLAKGSPTYIMAKDQLTLADLNQQTTVSEFLPSVSLNGSYQKSGTDWSALSSNKSLSVSASIPIFPGGSNIADRVIYGLLLDKARQDYAKNYKDLIYNISSAYSDLIDALEAYAVQKQYYTAGEERAKISQLKYVNGLMTYDEWDRTQNEYVNVQVSLLRAEQTALQAEAAWYKSYGGYVK